jgi:NAD(P)-dependent dehydrogenase (short-subunit alcohol dehydrogenase family)
VSEQPVALVTGASRGIGAAIAQEFGRAGFRVALTATSPDALEHTAAAIHADGGTAHAASGDLADLTVVRHIAESTLNAFGRIDVLVNNAASREIVSMRRITPESWDHTLRVCLTAPAFLSRWVAEDMERRSRGVIINVSSIMSQQAAGISPAYAASKGGLDALTFELASLYGPRGIRVVGLQVGAVDTEMSRKLSQSESSGDELRAFADDMIMLGRWASPEEIAKTVRFIASEDAAYITGTNLTIDGGWRHQHFPLSIKRRNFADDYR